MTALLHAGNRAYSDDEAHTHAVRQALERTMEQARHYQQRYMVVPLTHFQILNEAFPSEVPEWSDGFCFSADERYIPQDGACAVICLLNKGHQGECGGHDLMAKVDRSEVARDHAYLVLAALR